MLLYLPGFRPLSLYHDGTVSLVVWEFRGYRRKFGNALDLILDDRFCLLDDWLNWEMLEVIPREHGFFCRASYGLLMGWNEPWKEPTELIFLDALESAEWLGSCL